jgi:N utilization substance protein B
VNGVRRDIDRLDGVIRAASEHWRVERMSRVDRNVLRIGAWELESGVPRPVTIDEAVELAKRFGTAESGAFVNGILDRIADNLNLGA